MISGKNDRYVLFVLSFSLFCCMLGVGVISPILPVYAVKLGASGTLLGLILSSFSMSRLSCSLLSGSLADRQERKKLIMFGLSIYTLSSLAYLFVETSWHIVAIRFFNGMGSAFVVPVAMSIGSDIAENGKEGKFFGTLQMALFSGIGVGPLLSGLLSKWLGWNAPFLVMTFLTLAALIGIALCLPPGLPVSKSEKAGDEGSYLPLTKDPVLLRVYLFRFSTALGRGSMLMFVPLLSTEIGLSLLQIGAILSTVSLSTALFQVYTGKMADRIPKNRMILFGGIASACSLFMMPFMRSFPSLLIGGLAFGIGTAVGAPSITAIAAIRGKEYGTGRTMGLFNISFGLGMMCGPLLAGYVRDAGILSSPFVPIGVILTCTSLLFAFEKHFRSIESVACAD